MSLNHAKKKFSCWHFATTLNKHREEIMKKPLVAIVGRPNVGKSSFFNYIVGKRLSIVAPEPGVTRDRIYADANWCGYNFTLVDTGGLDSKSEDVFQQNIFSQAEIAIELADVIIFMVDGRDGVTQNDAEIAEFLRKSKKPIVLVVNKLDNFEVDKTYDFYELGIGQPFPVSTKQAKGIGEVLDEVVSHLGEMNQEESDGDVIKIAVVGRPNAGKSSIVNRILGEDRVVVSSVAGTTRDAIDSNFKYNGKTYTIIDTAGLRRKRGVQHESVESYSVLRTWEAIRRADVVLIVFDSSEEISEQDVRIAGYVHEERKPSLVIMNKWDKVEKNNNSINTYNSVLKEKLKFMSYFKPLYISALSGKRFGEIMPEVLKVYENNSKRITTGVLNEIIANAVLTNEPPFHNGKRLKIKYVTQAETNPPTFVLFVNDENCLHFSYQRYLENFLRNSVDFSGTPINIIVKGKGEK